jgi:hypothetical protein
MSQTLRDKNHVLLYAFVRSPVWGERLEQDKQKNIGFRRIATWQMQQLVSVTAVE